MSHKTTYVRAFDQATGRPITMAMSKRMMKLITEYLSPPTRVALYLE